jgi:glycerol-3-phosphate cytidylyltransferase
MRYFSNPFSNQKSVLGYTAGVFDLFHVGHLNLLRSAKGLCSKLVVGVSVKELVELKNKSEVIPFSERLQIVQSIKYVDLAIPQTNFDKFEAWERLHFDILFVGDDWYKDVKWQVYEKLLSEVGVKIIYLPYTKSTSSTLINQTLINLRLK